MAQINQEVKYLTLKKTRQVLPQFTQKNKHGEIYRLMVAQKNLM
ncbi:hypothetical protein COO91_04034 [Nostoc flagelliforme CCNUN1]|uniref:Uncharacterized protein n=1 Tax=Nostoc flagelliforme CCNUN1 TaxID=2038116 RepID=A0A2K8STF5_9NOSO|nr:hypothetical protein COO91_04034 [Nostoc flagelliforme CCNUN1]